MTFQWFQYGGYIDFRVIQLENDIDNPQILFQKIISLGKYNYKFFVGLHGDWTCIILLFVETPRKFINAKLSIRTLENSSVDSANNIL